MAKEIFEFNYEHYSSTVKIEVDREEFTEDMAEELFTFWGKDYEDEDDIIFVALMLIAVECMNIGAGTANYHVDILIEDFKNKEGFFPLDGSKGLTLVEFEPLIIDELYIEVEIVSDDIIDD